MLIDYTYADSEPATATLRLEGLWLHDPVDPAGSVLNLRYGRALRSYGIEQVSSLTHYPGRALPVVSYGDGRQETLRVGAQIPNGPDHRATWTRLRALARARRPLILRDNRGRCLTGVLTGYTESDQRWGTAVTFLFHRTDAPALTNGDSE